MLRMNGRGPANRQGTNVGHIYDLNSFDYPLGLRRALFFVAELDQIIALHNVYHKHANKFHRFYHGCEQT